MANKVYGYADLQLKLVQNLFHQQELIPRVSSIVSTEDFDDDKLKNIFHALSELNYQGQAEITVSDLYEFHVNSNQPFPDDLYSLLTSFNLDSTLSLARLLKKKSAQEKTRIHLQAVSAQLEGDVSNPQEIIGKAEEFLGEMSQSLIEKDELTLSQTVKLLGEKIQQKEAPEVETVPLFFKSLEAPLKGGWHPEQLITIGARTGVGKSVFAVDSAVAACAAGRSVLFFSLEMSSDELLKRMISVVSGVLLSKLEPGVDKTEEEQRQIDNAVEEISTWKLTIEDKPDVTLEHIKARSKMQSQTKEGLDLIFVDYLQLINPGNSGKKSRQEIVADLSRGMKLLAKQLKVPVMIVVQLNREDKGEDEDRLPSKADIRESAAIAADSDVIIILHRKYRDDSPDPKALFILDKNRNGQSNRKYSMRCVLEKSMFVDIEDEDLDETSEFEFSSNESTTEEMVANPNFNDFYPAENEEIDFGPEFTAAFGD